MQRAGDVECCGEAFGLETLLLMLSNVLNLRILAETLHALNHGYSMTSGILTTRMLQTIFEAIMQCFVQFLYIVTREETDEVSGVVYLSVVVSILGVSFSLAEDMGAFTLAFWYKESDAPTNKATGVAPRALEPGMMPHMQWEREEPFAEGEAKPVAVLVFHNYPQRIVLHCFFLGEFTTRIVALVFLAATVAPGFFLIYVLLAVPAAVGVLAVSRVWSRDSSWEETAASMSTKKVRWLLHVIVQLFVTVQTEETPPSQVFALHGYRAVETLIVASVAFVSSEGAFDARGSLFGVYWGFLIVAEAALAYLAHVSQGRTTTIGEDATLSCKVTPFSCWECNCAKH